MSARGRQLLLAPVLAAAAIAIGCGKDEPQIPRDDANAIIDRLKEAKRRMNEDPPVCEDTQDDTLKALDEQVAGLPEKTDGDVKKTLEDGIAYLRDLVETQCSQPQDEPEETTPTETAPPETTPPEPTPPKTTPPETTPPETTPPETTPPETTPPTTPNDGGVPPGQEKKQKKAKG